MSVKITLPVILVLCFGCQKKVAKVELPPAPISERSTTTDESSPPAAVPKNSLDSKTTEHDRRVKLLEKTEELEKKKRRLRSGRAHKSPSDASAREADTEVLDRYERRSSMREMNVLDDASLLEAEKTTEPIPAVSSRTGALATTVKAASHDDNEEIVSYRDYCGGVGAFLTPYDWDVSERYIVKLTFADSSTAWDHNVTLSDATGTTLFSARTPASGEVVLLPKIDLDKNYKSIGDYTLSIDNGKKQPVIKGVDDLLRFTLPGTRPEVDSLTLQICFLMDVTGSMSDEIAQLQDVIYSIHSRIVNLPSHPKVQFSIVEYRDKRDRFVVRGHHFTDNIDAFQVTLDNVKAGGGGDYPEDIETGFAWVLDSLRWQQQALGFVFLIADAPPHLNRKKRNYLTEARACRQRGIMVCPIGASGLDHSGEYVFRQIALLTKGQFVFLHYGETGESDGSATPVDPGKVSHHTGSNYNARRLDDIVVDIVSGELSYLCPPEQIVRHYPEPKEQDELIDLRVDNLIRQVVPTRVLSAGKTVVLSPVAAADTSLQELADYLWETALEKLPSRTEAAIVERQRLEEVLKEQALSLSGATAQTGDLSVGKLLNADFMILSRLQFLGAMRFCSMRLVDCGSGEVVRAARVRL